MAFLLFAIAASAVGIVFVLMRNRRPNTMEHSIEEFERGLRALAPEYRCAARRVRTSKGAAPCLAISPSISVRRTPSCTRAGAASS